MPRCPPVLKRAHVPSRNNVEDDNTPPRKPWTAYLGPAFLVVLLLAPQPSWILLLVSPYVSSSHRFFHLAITTVLTLLAFNSLAICTFRDPGRPKIDDIDCRESNYAHERTLTVDHFDEEDEGLLAEEEEDPNDFNSSRKWCRICWAPKPDRTHHCSSCGRCVLRMDHHCPWVSQCVGHRTHAAFLHLLLCVTILSLYIGITSSFAFYDFLFAPLPHPMEPTTPLHCFGLVVMGWIFAMVIGSFFGFHIYLSFTNQTTLEQLSPFLLLRYLPKPKVARHAPGTSITHGVGPPPITRNVPIPSGPPPSNDSPYYFPSPPPTPPLPDAVSTLKHALRTLNPMSTISSGVPDTPTSVNPDLVFSSSSPVATTDPNNTLPPMPVTTYEGWDEHSLSFAQRRLVRRAADRQGLWDLGWRRNIVAVLGSGDPSLRRRGRLREEVEREEEGGRFMRGLSSRPWEHRSTNMAARSASYPMIGRWGWGGQVRAYSWKWWLSVLLNGGPPRGDGKSFPRNPKARAVLEELRRELEEVERRERGDTAVVDGQTRIRHNLATAAVQGPRRGPRGREGGDDEMELQAV